MTSTADAAPAVNAARAGFFVGARIYDKGQGRSGVVLLAQSGILIYWCDGCEAGEAHLDMQNDGDCLLMDEGHVSPRVVRQLIARCSPQRSTLQSGKDMS